MSCAFQVASLIALSKLVLASEPGRTRLLRQGPGGALDWTLGLLTPGWHSVKAVMDPDKQEIRLFVDGSLVENRTPLASVA